MIQSTNKINTAIMPVYYFVGKDNGINNVVNILYTHRWKKSFHQIEKKSRKEEAGGREEGE